MHDKCGKCYLLLEGMVRGEGMEEEVSPSQNVRQNFEVWVTSKDSYQFKYLQKLLPISLNQPLGPAVPLEKEEVDEESPPKYSTATGEEVFVF